MKVSGKCELLPLSGSAFKMLAENCYTLIDIRPKSEFTANHINSSVNIHCSPLLIRRLQRSRRSLENLFLPDEIQRRLQKELCQIIIIYDNDSCEGKIAKELIQVANIFLNGKRSRSLFYLDGGMKQFSLENQQLCTSLPLSLQTDVKFDEVIRDPSDHMLFSGVETEPVQLLPHLFIGGAQHAANREILQRVGITAIINVSKTCRNYFEESFTYQTIPVDDSFNEDIASYFGETSNFIESVRRQNGKVLVHCKAGMSRSVTICMAYFIIVNKLSLDEAYEFIKARKSNISPNFNFLGQLLRLETSTKMSCKSNTNVPAETPCLGDEILPSPRMPLESLSKNSPQPTRQIFSFPSDMSSSCTGPFRFSNSIGTNSPKLLPTPT